MRPARRRRRRRPIDALPLIALVVLAGVCWFFRDELLAPLRASGPGASTAQAGDPAGTEPKAGVSVTGADPGRGAAGPEATPEDATAAGRARRPATTDVPDDHPADVAAADVGVDAPSEGGRDRAPDGPDPIPAIAAPSDADLGVLVARWEAAPADEQALLRLVAARRARGEIDAALEDIVRFAEAGGAHDVAGEWTTVLDPFFEARQALLLDHAERLLAEARAAFRKGDWLVAASLLQDAEILAGSAALGPIAALAIARRPPGENDAGPEDPGHGDDRSPWRRRLDDDSPRSGSTKPPGGKAREPAPTPPPAPDDPRVEAFRESLAEARERLHGTRDAVRRLASLGAPLPADVETASRLRRRTAERRDEEFARSGRPHTLASRHFEVTTRLGWQVAEQILEVLEELYDAQRERFLHDPLGEEKLRVEVVTDPDVFESRRTELEPGTLPTELAFHAVKRRRMVVLDPRATGAPFEQLWGLLAREVTRSFVRPPTVGPADTRRGSPWIEAAMCLDRTGARRLADGRLALDRLPEEPWQIVRQSLDGTGERRGPSLHQVLTMPRHDPELSPWAWSLGWYLMEARDADEQPRWGDGFARLVARVRGGSGLSALAEFQRWILAGLTARDGGDADVSLADVEQDWSRWIAAQAALDRGEQPAIDAALAKVKQHLERRRPDQAARLLRRIVAARPDGAEALALRMRLGQLRRSNDEALLAARHLIQTRQPSGAWSPTPGSERTPLASRRTSERIRWAEAIELRDTFGERAAENDLALRAAVESQVDAQLAAGQPLAAVRLLETLLVVWPLDVGYAAMRAALLDEVLDTTSITKPRRIPWPQDVTAHGADPTLWVPQASGLVVRCADRVVPATLRGLAQLRPPCRVQLEVSFARDADGRAWDDRTNFAGLLLGAETASNYGAWGLFATPAGRIELATRGHLEWPSVAIGRTSRGVVELTVHLTGRHFEVAVTDRSLGRRPLGVRAVDGWLGLFVRHADVTFRGLTVTAERLRDPRTLWTLGLGS